jgi:hypothetical protein
MYLLFFQPTRCPTVCVSGRADGRDSIANQNHCQQAAAYLQGEALSAARCVGWLLGTPDTLPEDQNHAQLDKIIAQTFCFFNHQKA